MKITKKEAKRLIDATGRLYRNHHGHEGLGENGYYAMLAIDAAIQGGVTADEFKLDKSLQNHAQNLKNAIWSDVRRYIASEMQWCVLINDDNNE